VIPRIFRGLAWIPPLLISRQPILHQPLPQSSVLRPALHSLWLGLDHHRWPWSPLKMRRTTRSTRFSCQGSLGIQGEWSSEASLLSAFQKHSRGMPTPNQGTLQILQGIWMSQGMSLRPPRPMKNQPQVCQGSVRSRQASRCLPWCLGARSASGLRLHLRLVRPPLQKSQARRRRL